MADYAIPEDEDTAYDGYTQMLNRVLEYLIASPRELRAAIRVAMAPGRQSEYEFQRDFAEQLATAMRLCGD